MLNLRLVFYEMICLGFECDCFLLILGRVEGKIMLSLEWRRKRSFCLGIFRKNE